LKEAVRKSGVVEGKLTRFCTFFRGFSKKEIRNFNELVVGIRLLFNSSSRSGMSMKNNKKKVPRYFTNVELVYQSFQEAMRTGNHFMETLQ